ncbi:uncharacterized protein LOC136718016 isoform X2 [Amia ocellicauda]|uniref:uncharacterized protein LOC136718016 isoform X2 n=1 Tax=Amia ocellicauda TaxID=2972642 RepID=UPI003464660D
MGLEVLLYVPNVIGVDGWAARRLGQTSEFGAWLDVVIDNLGRGMLWSLLYEWGWLVVALEWCVFVCTHSTLGARWKSHAGPCPSWVQAVMAKGFKTPMGAFAISGLHVLPVWLYGVHYGVLNEPLSVPAWLQGLGLLLLTAGRLLCFSVEVWCIWLHIRYLTRDEEKAREKD